MPTLQEKIKSVFDDALEIETGHERYAFLAQRFDESPHIREGVESLLKAYDAAGSFP